MKKVLLILLLLFCISVPACAVNFVKVSVDDRYLIYVDVDSIELRKTNNNEYVLVWSEWIPMGDRANELFDEYKKTVEHDMVLWALNKNEKQMQMLSEITYDKKGNVIDSGSWLFQTSEYNEVVPNTHGEIIYDFVMDYYNKNEK